MKKSTAIVWGSLFTLGSISAFAADHHMSDTPQSTMERPHMEKKMPKHKQSMDKSMPMKRENMEKDGMKESSMQQNDMGRKNMESQSMKDKPMNKPMDTGMEKPSSMTK